MKPPVLYRSLCICLLLTPSILYVALLYHSLQHSGEELGPVMHREVLIRDQIVFAVPILILALSAYIAGTLLYLYAPGLFNLRSKPFRAFCIASSIPLMLSSLSGAAIAVVSFFAYRKALRSTPPPL